MRNIFLLNNNRNNRRRGRGNRNQGGGGGNQLNRIDSRARGNAPQLLDKYKKLAQDAQHNGDRVQAEYYLQFADHYFRVIADTRSRQDEVRAKRRDERGEDSYDDEDDVEDGDSRQQRGRDRGGDHRRDDGQRRGDRRSRQAEDDAEAEEEGGEDFGNADDADENEREERNARRARQPRGRQRNGSGHDLGDERSEIDMAVLPPAIGGADDDGDRPKRTLRRRKTPEDSEASAAG